MVNKPFDELTDKRQKVLKGLVKHEGEFTGRDRYDDGEFARSQANEVFRQHDLSDILGEEDEKGEPTLETTTDLLNKIQEEDGYLEKNQQGGESAFVIDTEANEESGEKVTGTSPSELSDLAFQVLDRHGISADLDHVDFADWRQVIETVNRLVGKRMLMIKSDPNLYEIPDEARGILLDEL